MAYIIMQSDKFFKMHYAQINPIILPKKNNYAPPDGKLPLEQGTNVVFNQMIAIPSNAASAGPR